MEVWKDRLAQRDNFERRRHGARMHVARVTWPDTHLSSATKIDKYDRAVWKQQHIRVAQKPVDNHTRRQRIKRALWTSALDRDCETIRVRGCCDEEEHALRIRSNQSDSVVLVQVVDWRRQHLLPGKLTRAAYCALGRILAQIPAVPADNLNAPVRHTGSCDPRRPHVSYNGNRNIVHPNGGLIAKEIGACEKMTGLGCSQRDHRQRVDEKQRVYSDKAFIR